jgi:hypothetical protein
VSLQRLNPALVLAAAVASGAATHCNSAQRPVFGAAEGDPAGPAELGSGDAVRPAGGRKGPRCYRPDLNRDPAHRLRLLRGVGPVRAAALVAERLRGGEFGSFEEVARRVSGVGPVTVRRLASSAVLGPLELKLALSTVRLDEREDLE